MQCINLLEKFGKQYRITFDEAYDPRNVPRAKLDAWAMQIPCHAGTTIYPHGGNTLTVEVVRKLPCVKQLMALEGVKLYQDGELEKSFHFDVALFSKVAQIVKAKKRRQLTDKQRQTSLANFARLREKRNLNLQGRAQTASDDLLATVNETGPLF